MNRKTAVKTILILVLAPVLAAVMLFLIGGIGLGSSFYILIGAGGLADQKPDQVIFVNESSVQISSVKISTGVLQDSREFFLDGEEEITIDWDAWPCTLKVDGAEGDMLAELVISEDPNEDFAQDQWYVVAQDGSEGLTLTLSHVHPLEDVVEWACESSGIDVSGGLIQQFLYRHGAFGDGDTFLAMTFTPEQSGELEQAMAAAQGWHQFPVHELIDKIFYSQIGYCEGADGENRVPQVENGWFFFRDTYNANHGENDENQWVLEGRTRLPGNFTAGIYDSDTGTLYLFDYDS